MSITIQDFGKTSRGETVHSFTIYQADGTFCTLLTYGATLQRLLMPDRQGRPQDIVLGYDDMAGYEGEGNAFYGATIGRCCNRIGGAAFELDGQTCRLAANDGANHLHGGLRGFDKVVWHGEPVTMAEGPAVNFYYHSPAGEEGYPGSLEAQATYILTADHRLIVRYTAVADSRTLINMTNHSYFNLTGQGSGSILRHELQLEADSFTPTDEQLIPTGEIAPVSGTPLDFRQMKPIGRDIGADDPNLAAADGYDQNFIIRGEKGLRLGATVYDPKSGRVMEVLSTLPGLQVYTGNFMKPDTGKEGVRYDRRNGFCLESQYYPDAIHHPHFPQPVFDAGEPFRHETVFRFSVR